MHMWPKKPIPKPLLGQISNESHNNSRFYNNMLFSLHVMYMTYHLGLLHRERVRLETDTKGLLGKTCYFYIGQEDSSHI